MTVAALTASPNLALIVVGAPDAATASATKLAEEAPAAITTVLGRLISEVSASSETFVSRGAGPESVAVQLVCSGMLSSARSHLSDTSTTAGFVVVGVLTVGALVLGLGDGEGVASVAGLRLALGVGMRLGKSSPRPPSTKSGWGLDGIPSKMAVPAVAEITTTPVVMASAI